MHGRPLTHPQQCPTGAEMLALVRLLPSSHPAPGGGWGRCGSAPEPPGRWAASGTSLWDTDPHGMAACRSPLQEPKVILLNDFCRESLKLFNSSWLGNYCLPKGHRFEAFASSSIDEQEGSTAGQQKSMFQNSSLIHPPPSRSSRYFPAN